MCAVAMSLVGCAGINTNQPPAGVEVNGIPSSSIAPEALSSNSLPDGFVKKNPEDYDDVWDRVRAGYGLAELDSPYIARHEQWFANNPEYMQRMVERASLYLHHIITEVEKRNIPTEIALLPAIESAFKPHAYSRARAAGLWQFIPSTGRLYGLQKNWWYDGRRDIVAATDAALNYLEKLRDDFDGDWHLALAAYNAGEGRVMRARRHNRLKNRPDNYEDLTVLKPETRNYVPKLIAVANIIRNPEKYGLTLAPIPNEPYFDVVDVGSQIDLAVLSKESGVPIGDLYDLNPAFNRWATAPDGPYRLLVPVKEKEAVVAALEALPIDERTKWARHNIRRGETLSTIARNYGVSVAAIKSSNKIRGHQIRAGHDLLIPMSTRSISTKVANVTRPRPTATRPAPPPSGHVAVVHEVKAGDTLWNIATRYNVYISQITRWNLINRRSVLRLGQKLKIWVEPTNAPDSASISTGVPST